MTAIAPKYSCDSCNIIVTAPWDGQPDWGIPEGWQAWSKNSIINNKHYCDKCTQKNNKQNQI